MLIATFIVPGFIFGVSPLVAVAAAVGAYLWSRPIDRMPYVLEAFKQSRGARYSWGGGHPPGPKAWPSGSPGKAGGKGFDCSGYILNLALRAPSPPDWARRNIAVGEIYNAVGRPTNGGNGAVPGNLLFFGRNGIPLHIAIMTGPDRAISAFGHGEGVNGDDPNATVTQHTIRGVGMPLIGSSSW
jgi:cell wall-associated NlpC family hydrolase